MRKACGLACCSQTNLEGRQRAGCPCTALQGKGARSPGFQGLVVHAHAPCACPCMCDVRVAAPCAACLCCCGVGAVLLLLLYWCYCSCRCSAICAFVARSTTAPQAKYRKFAGVFVLTTANLQWIDMQDANIPSQLLPKKLLLDRRVRRCHTGELPGAPSY